MSSIFLASIAPCTFSTSARASGGPRATSPARAGAASLASSSRKTFAKRAKSLPSESPASLSAWTSRWVTSSPCRKRARYRLRVLTTSCRCSSSCTSQTGRPCSKRASTPSAPAAPSSSKISPPSRAWTSLNKRSLGCWTLCRPLTFPQWPNTWRTWSTRASWTSRRWSSRASGRSGRRRATTCTRSPRTTPSGRRGSPSTTPE
mmetsp:Transcript_96289/g.272204  ORF Transcript_96289/g.272204 Transcript_96289/m.272204 type:complete len:204 (-) Transcript_96289:383-994(-)